MIHSSGSRFQKYSPEIRNPGDEGLPYVKNARKTRILSVVALLHAGVLLLPLLFMIVKERTKKVPLYVMHVPVVDSVPGSASPRPSARREKTPGIPDKVFPPEDLPELPKIEKLLPERKEPSPAVRKNPVVRTQPEVEVQTKKVIKVRKKPVRKTVRISTKRVRRTVQRIPQKDPASEQRARQRAEEARRRADLAKTLRRMGGPPGKQSVPGGRSSSSAVASPEVQRYYDLVDLYLRRRWNQPRGIASRNLQSVIRFSVDKNGRIRFVRIEKRSGNPVMDHSVEQLIRTLNNRLPSPPSPMEFTVTLEMDR